MIWGLSDAMAKTADPGPAGMCCRAATRRSAYHVLAPEAYVQVKNLIEKTVASGLIFLNSHARDFETPELRPYLDRFVRGSGGVSAMERVKLMKLLWDGVGTEFGGRHELYEDQLCRQPRGDTPLRIVRSYGIGRRRSLEGFC